MAFSSISIITDGWMSVVLNSMPHPSSRNKHIDISSTLEQPTSARDFSALATLNMDLSELNDHHMTFDLLTMSPTVLSHHPDLQMNEVVTLASGAKEGSCRDTTPFHLSLRPFPEFLKHSGFLWDSCSFYPSPYLTISSLSQTVYANRCPRIHRLL